MLIYLFNMCKIFFMLEFCTVFHFASDPKDEWSDYRRLDGGSGNQDGHHRRGKAGDARKRENPNEPSGRGVRPQEKDGKPRGK